MVKLAKIILTICLLLGMSACGRVDKDLINDPQYSHVVGKQFRIKVETGVYKNYDSKKILRIRQIGDQIFPERDKIKPPFPIEYYGTIILGILPPGSEFKVVKVKEEGSATMSYICYYGEITKSLDAQWVGKVVDVELEPKTYGELIPTFEPQYVEEIK